jgi:hypothetical protein
MCFQIVIVWVKQQAVVTLPVCSESVCIILRNQSSLAGDSGPLECNIVVLDEYFLAF